MEAAVGAFPNDVRVGLMQMLLRIMAQDTQPSVSKDPYWESISSLMKKFHEWKTANDARLGLKG